MGVFFMVAMTMVLRQNLGKYMQQFTIKTEATQLKVFRRFYIISTGVHY
jgi:hypothetical protein